MAPRVKARINRDVLVWARESAGLSLAAASKRASVQERSLEAWEQGPDQFPSIPQLRRLGTAYKRPIAVFYLPEKPLDFQPLRDFRRLPGQAPRLPSPELQFEIRRAQQRRELAEELWRELEGVKPPDFPLSASLSDDPEELGKQIRNLLAVPFTEQLGFRDGYQALACWRAAFERSGVLVFQTTGVELREARGFSLSEKPFPAVAMNSKDAPHGRVFSMFHELAHVMLHDGGLCTFSDEGNSNHERVEAFCNRVAAAALLPRDELLALPLVASKPGRYDWSLTELQSLSRKVSASREAVLRRLLTLGRTTKRHYEETREELVQEYKNMEPGAGFVLPPDKALNRCGRLFARLVLGSYHERRISASDVSDFLEVRLKHLPTIHSNVYEGSN